MSMDKSLKNTQKRRPMGGPMGAMGAPVEKAKNFKGTLKRLLRYLKPHRINLLIVLIFAIASTAFSVYSPQKIKDAMNTLQDGFTSKLMIEKMIKGQNYANSVITKIDADKKNGLNILNNELKDLQGQTEDSKAKNSQSNMDPEQIMADFENYKKISILSEATDGNKKADICVSLIDSMKENNIIAALMLKDDIKAANEKKKNEKDSDKKKDSDDKEKNKTGLNFSDEQIVGVIKAIRETNGKINFDEIAKTAIFLIALYLLSWLFSVIMGLVMSGVAQKTVRDLRTEVDAKLAKLPLKYYDIHPHGDILSRVTNDVDTIATTLQQSLTQIITAVVTIIGYIIMMLTISPILTVIMLATMPLYILTTSMVAKKSQKYFAAQQKEIGLLSGHVEEMYTGHKVVKAFGKEKDSIEEFSSINKRLEESSWKAQFVSGIMFPMMNFISNIGYVLICIVGGIWIVKNRLKMGDITAFIQYSKSFTFPIVQTANIANVIQSTIACAERVFEILDEEEEIKDLEDSKVLKLPKGEVAFENVSFRYKEEEPLIENMNLQVKKGHTIAIVGPTGAGKTTLVNLLMRFYEINEGKITVDGVDIRELKRSELRKMYGMVLQDTWLFNGTIKDNIAYGKDGVSMDDIVKASKAAHADHFIRTLPDGYNTILNEEATNISQGQKQLLTIARAILADPTILILDEATSSVDTRTEVLIQKAMANLMKDRTSFVIAHRLSTIRDAEVILVMNKGSILEMGNHKELLQKGGFYADLYNSQFAGTDESQAV